MVTDGGEGTVVVTRGSDVLDDLVCDAGPLVVGGEVALVVGVGAEVVGDTLGAATSAEVVSDVFPSAAVPPKSISCVLALSHTALAAAAGAGGFDGAAAFHWLSVYTQVAPAVPPACCPPISTSPPAVGS